MRKIRIAQIGVNFYSHGPDIFRSIVKQSDIFEVVGYCLPENERTRLPDRLKAFDGYPELTLEEILNDPSIDAVTVETDVRNIRRRFLCWLRQGVPHRIYVPL